ncbi:MAG: adenylate/guanylate cyclase domain-containing protein [Acidimicrobiales bacterium]
MTSVGAATVAFLFTDLVSSTEMLDRMGDDAYDSLRRDHFRLLRTVLSERAGREIKNLGDGLMVVFNSSVDALTSAVAIQQAVEQHNGVRPPEDALAVRIGVHVGEPIAADDDYFGRPVVVAKRLCDQAASGTILTSNLVRELIGSRGGFRFVDNEVRSLKGLSEPMSVWRIDWTPATEANVVAGALEIDRDRFVGRGTELDRLRTLWTQASGGGARVVFITGEPGIGKTTLSAALAAEVRSGGGLALYGRCAPDLRVPYQPFIEAVNAYAALAGPQLIRAELAQHADRLGRIVPSLAENGSGGAEGFEDAELGRYQLFEAAQAALAAGRTTPAAPGRPRRPSLGHEADVADVAPPGASAPRGEDPAGRDIPGQRGGPRGGNPARPSPRGCLRDAPGRPRGVGRARVPSRRS